MLCIWQASGSQLASIPVENVTDVLSLKRHLGSLCGVSRFRQRLLQDGEVLKDALSPLGIHFCFVFYKTQEGINNIIFMKVLRDIILRFSKGSLG